MKKAPLKKVLEKISAITIDLGKAAVITGFASLFLEPVRWLYVIGGATLNFGASKGKETRSSKYEIKGIS